MLLQKIRQVSPFDDTGQFIVQENDSAMVWLWDDARRLSSIADAEDQHPELTGLFARLPVVPETVFRPKAADGVLVVRHSDGYESQDWKDDVLVDSEWKQAGVVESPAVTLASPWSGSKVHGSLLNEALWFRGAALVLILLLVMQVGAMAGWSAKVALKERQAKISRLETSEVLSLRSKVRRLRSDNETLLGWLDHPSQIATLADFDELLQETAEISRWEYQTGELVATVNDKRLNNRRFIESLSSGSHFENVRVDPGARLGTVIISLEVKP